MVLILLRILCGSPFLHLLFLKPFTKLFLLLFSTLTTQLSRWLLGRLLPSLDFFHVLLGFLFDLLLDLFGFLLDLVVVLFLALLDLGLEQDDLVNGVCELFLQLLVVSV